MSGVVSVGAAVGATAMAASSVAAAGMTMTSVMAITAAVGATASAVGYFTKSKELMIGGAALGLVGGIGSMAAGAGMFGAEGAMGAGGITATAGPAGGYTATLGADGLGTTMGAAGGFAGSSFVGAGGAGSFSSITDLINGKGLSTDVLSSITGGTPPADTLLQTPSATLPSGNVGAPTDQFGQTIAQGGGEGGTLGVTDNPGAVTQPPGLIDTPAATPPGQAPTTPLPDFSGNPPTSTGPYQSTMPAGTDIPIVTTQPGSTQPVTAMPAAADASPWAGILKFMKENQTLIAAGGAFLKGAFDPKTDAEVSALNAVAARNTAEANLTNRQVSNMGQPVPRATRTRTNTGTGRIDRLPA